MKSLCVFCGSSSGKNTGIQEEAAELGRLLARENITLVYGGGSVGLMGILANATLSSGGKVIGVIPRAIERREIVHRGLTELHVVESMHERKAMMASLADGFMALPGGLGTLEELFEVMTWAQLGLHHKPIGLLNACGYYDPIMAFFDRAVTERYLWSDHKRIWVVDSEPARLLKALRAYVPPPVDQWLNWNQV